jgi:hypothetical protein
MIILQTQIVTFVVQSTNNTNFAGFKLTRDKTFLINHELCINYELSFSQQSHTELILVHFIYCIYILSTNL